MNKREPPFRDIDAAADLQRISLCAMRRSLLNESLNVKLFMKILNAQTTSDIYGKLSVLRIPENKQKLSNI